MSETVAAILIVVGLINLLGVFGLWRYLAQHSEHVGSIDRRVSVLEERVSGMPAVKCQLDALSSAVAAIDERTRTTVTAVHSIQDYLRTRDP